MLEDEIFDEFNVRLRVVSNNSFDLREKNVRGEAYEKYFEISAEEV